MLRQKFKKIINGVLAAVMLAGTFTAVSYVRPIGVSAANGTTEWYNPALRWKETENYRENILIANSIVSSENAHCQNAACPSNSINGFDGYIGGETFYQRDAVWYEEYDDDDNLIASYWADITSEHNKLDESATWTEYGTVRYWANEYGRQGETSGSNRCCNIFDKSGHLLSPHAKYARRSFRIQRLVRQDSYDSKNRL